MTHSADAATIAASIADLHAVSHPDLHPNDIDTRGLGGGYPYEIIGTVSPPLAAGFRAIAVPHSPATGSRTFALYATGPLPKQECGESGEQDL